MAFVINITKSYTWILPMLVNTPRLRYVRSVRVAVRPAGHRRQLSGYSRTAQGSTTALAGRRWAQLQKCRISLTAELTAFVCCAYCECVRTGCLGCSFRVMSGEIAHCRSCVVPPLPKWTVLTVLSSNYWRRRWVLARLDWRRQIRTEPVDPRPVFNKKLYS